MSKHIGSSIGRATVSGALAGAVIGGAVSAAKQTKDYKAGKITKEQAAENVVKEAAGTGIATAAGVAAASMFGFGVFMSLIAFTAASAGAKYLWDSSVKPTNTETVKES
ncbi:hypothetical protein [Seleniivibrio sp.]|uniref:hypothetical protein n=1 Tax=Seleniivibrio sp. TaxID=2898801 RepID=UPI0025E37F0F|nr:hypothetical protein [Seleniivibrio sp.]MCD8553450.1 magnetosome protein MamC [Seleniivibrio sp.]